MKETTKNEKFCRESNVIQTYRIFPSDLNPYGFLFGGKLMSLIDNVASISASRHCRQGVVTASVDNLNFLKPLHENHSLCIKSYVSGSHKRSMEIFVKVVGEDLVTGSRYLAATCFITFVAVLSEKATKEDYANYHVAKVIPETDEEKLVCAGFEERRQKRLAERDNYKDFAAQLSTDLPWDKAGENY